ncbi:fused MFS/spermidine synthase [Simplicispira suum]|uniref:Spermidine synthase n=1 Tax=Simplicispira suum TaxID=2109915 RepID=A0A2S0MZL5_9BURK|nr:fused MFS/spermidine synthase [Simplicispira suum]AVO41342.1 spermidine synthase [Simplicispira suum]
MSPDTNHRHRHALLAIFVLSGFAGLIYQSIWSHYLGLFLGHAAYAQALVLAIFMGGMATGAAWIAHAGQRWRNLVRGYALIEAAIGVLGLLFHWIFTGVAAFSYDWLIPALGSPWAVDIARWGIAALLIFPQTILLGMTFPLMSGGLIRRFPGREGSLLGGLYFTNSIGAAIGALAAVFILLPWVGLPGAMVAAGILNFLVAALAWWLAREPEPVPVAPTEAKAAPEQRLLQNPLLRLVLFGTALSGAASFAYEIVWIRMLSMAVGSTMHAFELMLASFIAGIALGGLWVRNHADRTESPLRLVGWMQVGMGVAALVSLGVYANAFSWVGWLMGSLAKSDGGYALFNLGTATIAIAIMLPAAFFAGTTLPLFTVTLLREGLGERAIGRVYAWNTLGSIVGVFAAIHLLIPTLGLKLTLCVAAVLDIGIGLFLLRLQINSRHSMIRFAVAAGISAVALMVAVRIPYDPMKLASGVFRYGDSEIDAGTQKVVYYRDGKTSSVAVIAGFDGSANISTNGKPDAGIMVKDGGWPTSDEPTMTLAAALPLTMLDKPAHVGVIGFGSGMTTHTLLGDPRVKQVDTVEIEPAMVEGARLFGDRVGRAYTDPRSRIVIDDAKAFFAANPTKYDIVISEPSNPWISGVGTLFSKEFYQFVPTYLNENGLFVQWVQLYEINEELIGSIFNAMSPHFEDYAAWMTNGSDMLIVASPKGKLPKSDLNRLFQNPGPLKAELARLGITTQEILDFRKIADARMLRGIARLYNQLPPNSDYFPILGLYAPKSRYQGITAEAISTLPAQEAILLEASGIRLPLPLHMVPSKLAHFPADTMTWRARALLAELAGQLGTQLPDLLPARNLSPAILMREAARKACEQSWNPATSHQLSIRIREFSVLTNAFLPSSALRDVWSRRDWIPCKVTSPDIARTLSLMNAISTRDWNAMQDEGRKWFALPPQDSAIYRDYEDMALSALLLSLAHQDQWKELLEADEQIGLPEKSDNVYQLHRRLLRAMARDQNGPGLN